jgi:hypothetical protein
MTQISPVVFKKFFLPVPLYEQFSSFVKKIYEVEPFSREHFNLIHTTLENFDMASIRLSSNIGDYKNFLTTVFSTRTFAYPFYLRKSDLAKINAIRYRFNIGPANALKLIMSTYLYQSGDRFISVNDLVSSFMLGYEYKYPVVLSREINDLYEHTMRQENKLSKTMYIRAAQFYYTSLAPEVTEVSEGPMFRVDNQCTGWKKIMIRGGPHLKDYVAEVKKKTGKPIGVIINNILYLFLNQYNGRNQQNEKTWQ